MDSFLSHAQDVPFDEPLLVSLSPCLLVFRFQAGCSAVDRVQVRSLSGKEASARCRAPDLENLKAAAPLRLDRLDSQSPLLQVFQSPPQSEWE